MKDNKEEKKDGSENTEPRAKNWKPRTYYLADQNNLPLDLGEDVINEFVDEDVCKKWIKESGVLDFAYYIAYKSVSVKPTVKSFKPILN